MPHTIGLQIYLYPWFYGIHMYAPSSAKTAEDVYQMAPWMNSVRLDIVAQRLEHWRV